MIEHIIARLKSNCVAFAGRVEGPTNTSINELPAYPTAVVYPLSDSIETSLSGIVSIRRYSVVIKVDDWTALEPLISSASNALNGYKPSGAISQISVINGKIVEPDGNYMQWVLTIECKMCV